MFVELIDHLRCPEPHEDSWLVMHASETRDRHVITGALGCPVCRRRYDVEEGTVYFGERSGTTAAPRAALDAPDGEWPMRLAAFLGLQEGGGAVGLFGEWARYAAALAELVEGIELLAVAPAVLTDAMLSAVVPASTSVVPIATGLLRGVAVDRANAGAVSEAARIVRSGGRLLAPADAPVPPGVRELARDDAWWVGAREGQVSGLVPMRRRQG